MPPRIPLIPATLPRSSAKANVASPIRSPPVIADSGVNAAQSIVTGGILAKYLVESAKNGQCLAVIDRVDDPLALASGRDQVLRPEHRQLLRQGWLEYPGPAFEIAHAERLLRQLAQQEQPVLVAQSPKQFRRFFGRSPHLGREIDGLGQALSTKGYIILLTYNM